MSNKTAVRKLLSLLTKYRKIIIIIIICLVVKTGLNLCIPLISRRIMDDGFIGGDRTILIQLVLTSFGIYALNSLIDYIKEKKRVDISAKVEYSLSQQSFLHLMKMKINYFNSTNHTEILNNINMDISRMATIADNTVFFVITQIFSIIGGIIGLFIIDPRMTALVLLFIPVKFVIMKYLAKKQRKGVDNYIGEHQKYARWFGDTMGGVREIRLFGIEKHKQQEFDREKGRMIERQRALNMLGQWNSISEMILYQLLVTVLYIIGSDLVFGMRLSVGSVFAFITYSTYVTGPISAILNIGYFLSGIIPSTIRYYEFMDLEEETDPELLDADRRADRPSMGDLVMERVSFAYETDKPVLREMTAHFPKGSKTALIGRNGSGKSTIINLLTRLYEKDSGRILLNGTDIERLSLADYRRMVAVVSQQIYLFSGTIRDNIALHREVDDHAVTAVCGESGLGDFIAEVSLDYQVGNDGAMLSGGQKQKIALARALIGDTPIIIFDEATANTDAYSEQQINGLLHTRLKDKTVIIISHRQEILKEVDRIMLIEEGQVSGSGRYEEMAGYCSQALVAVNEVRVNSNNGG